MSAAAPPVVAAPFLAATVILAGAGLAKIRRPDYTARALQAAGWRVGRRAVRAGAAVEVAVAVAAVAWPVALTGALVAVAYGAFAVFVTVALRRGWALSSCGCFGRPDSRPNYLHAVLNAAAALVALWWAAAPPGHLTRMLSSSPWGGAPLALVSAVIAGLAYLVWTNPLSQEVA